MTVRVQEEDFDVGAELAALSAGNPRVGGLCSFVGLVRDMNDVGGTVSKVGGMTLEHYPGMTEKMLAEIENVTSMSVDTALTVPEWFEFVDPDNKKKKSATEDADWIQAKLSGKNAEQKGKILAAMRLAAEEQRVAVWTRFNRKLRRKSATSKTKSDATPKPTPSSTAKAKPSATKTDGHRIA